MSIIKFYARGARMKGLNISGRTCRIFDSDFSLGTVEQSTFDEVVLYNCDIAHAKFKAVSFKGSYFYRLVAELTEFDGCDFTNSYMTDFTFDNCIFRQCSFTRCNMENVLFKSCLFYDCDFNEADLPPFFYPECMVNCTNIPYMPMACPEEGEIIGYKIASSMRLRLSDSIWRDNENHGPADVLVTLKIPADAKRSSAGGRKCRCDKAEVIGLEHITSHENLSEAISKYDINFEYHIGEKISVPDFDENRWAECSSGIHFFINRKEALQYYGVMEEYYGSK